MFAMGQQYEVGAWGCAVTVKGMLPVRGVWRGSWIVGYGTLAGLARTIAKGESSFSGFSGHTGQKHQG